MKLRTFKIDVTPGIGAPLAYGINKKVDSPIFIRGVIIDDSQKRIVLVSCDFIGIWGSAYREMKKIIAKSAGIDIHNVFLHSIHQHDSVWIAPELNRASCKYNNGIEQTPVDYFRGICKSLSSAIAKASVNLIPVKKTCNLGTANQRFGFQSSPDRGRRQSLCNALVYVPQFEIAK